MLEQKRTLASKIVGSGEQWITELDSDSLRDLFVLAESAVEASEEAEPGSAKPKRARRGKQGEARA
jgi:hypothetical protein